MVYNVSSLIDTIWHRNITGMPSLSSTEWSKLSYFLFLNDWQTPSPAGCYSNMGRSKGLVFDPPSESLEDDDRDSAEKAFGCDSLSISKKKRCLWSSSVQGTCFRVSNDKPKYMTCRGEKKNLPSTVWCQFWVKSGGEDVPLTHRNNHPIFGVHLFLPG